MRRLGTTSWQISVDGCSLLYDFPLWMRAAERIEVPPDPFVPGPLDIERLPEPTTEPGSPAGLGEAWLGWWRTVIGLPRWTFELAGSPPMQMDFSGPDVPGLTRWPELQRIATRRWPEALRWHDGRKERDIPRQLPSSPHVGLAVQAVERELGRPLRPIQLELVLLPVRDGAIRRVTEERYLIPERIFDGPRMSEWLREELRRLG
jgi:hypothetical protein